MIITRLVSHATSGLWFLPVMCVLAGALLSFGAIWLDRSFNYEAVPSDFVGGPDAAASILETIAVAMVSLTALVLTITMVVVQLAMGQFSPRIVQRFLQDKPSQLAIGLFVATFVHAILTLREVRIGADGAGQVPGIGVITAFVLVIASIAVLVLYVHHIGQSLRVSALIELVGSDTRRLLERLYPANADTWPGHGSTDQVVTARKSGVIVKIGHAELVEQARAVDCRLELVPSLGVFVPADAVLFRVHGDGSDLDRDRLHDALMFKLEPTLDEDVAYGVRLLVDIAERSLAESSFQDPTTAVQAIDRIHDLLRQLVRRPFPDGRYRDEAGVVRLVVPSMSWEAYVDLAFDEIRIAGAGSPPVVRRLAAALNDLRSIAPPERQRVLDEQLDRLRFAAREAMRDERDATAALGFGPLRDDVLARVSTEREEAIGGR